MTTASLHVVTSDARRGAETFAVDLAAGLETLGHRARVVALRPSRMDEALTMPALGERRRSPTTLANLRREARQADVVVAHGSSTLEACGVGLFGTGVPFIYRTIGDPSYWVTSGTRRRLVGVLLRRARRHIVLWPGAGAHLGSVYGIPTTGIEVIPNGVVAERFRLKDDVSRRRTRVRYGVPMDAPCLAFVGALSQEKDVATLLRGVGRLEGVRLLVAGDGAERHRLEAMGEQVAPGRVRFLGAVSDPHDVYVAADLLVLPSLSEGMPAVVVEAGLVGTPAVATAVGAVPEMIEDAVTGHLIPPGQPEVLAARVVEALPAAAEVGHRARTVFSNRYTMASVVPRWAAAVELARGRPR